MSSNIKKERGAALVLLLVPALLVLLCGGLCLVSVVRAVKQNPVAAVAQAVARSDPRESIPGQQKPLAAELSGPIELGTEGLVCVALPGISYPKTPALDRRVAPRLLAALNVLAVRGNAPLQFNYGFRTSCEQARLTPVGTTLKAPVGSSGHERGAAVDVQGLRARSDSGAIITAFREQGFSWGSADWPHFEIRASVLGEPDRFEWVRRQQRNFNEGRISGGCRGADCGGL